MGDGQRFADLVFEGGGVKGIGLAGAFAALTAEGFAAKRVAGTSAGAIAAALVAVGYTADELHDVLTSLPFASFKDKGWEDRVPVAGAGLSILLDRGIYEGRAFEAWMAEKLAAKGFERFGQLRLAQEDPSSGSPLRVIASDTTDRRMLVLPDDAAQLGVDPDELGIAYAVRMSMSIPIFFEPVVHRDPRDGRDHVIVDGGMLSNYPVWLFDCEGREPKWPTFGLKLVEPDPKQQIGTRLSAPEGDGIVAYIRSLAETMMEAHDRLYVEQAEFARTIPIPTLGVGTTEFTITPERIAALYASGSDAAKRFLEGWDFDAYVTAFRSGPAPSRTSQLQSTMGQA
jgi:NTE family protein